MTSKNHIFKIDMFMRLMGKIENVLSLLVMAACMVMLTMCGLKEGSVPDVPGGPSGGQDSPDIPSPPKADTLYVTGVEYPEGYDWGKDVEYGTVACSLFVEKNGERIIEVPVGHFYETASDPDMHRCIDGHLYTDYSSDSETVVKRDGMTLFRYPGREMIHSFHVADGDVYTAGSPRNGSGGFVFRKNGAATVSVGDGWLLSDIHSDGERICLAFSAASVFEYEGDTYAPGYYMYSGGEISAIGRSGAESDVLAARMIDGKICYVAGTGGRTGGYVLCAGGVTRSISTEGYGDIYACRIMSGKSDIFLSAYCCMSGECRYAVWRSSGTVAFALEPGELPYYSFIDGDDTYGFVAPDDSFSEMLCYRNGSVHISYGKDVSFLGSVPAAVCKGGLYFICSGKSAPRKPYMAEETDIRSFPFNGYFTSVSVW